MSIQNVAIVGAGLAGCECALYLAQNKIHVILFEQKPLIFSPAHKTPLLAELVCSNSFRSNEQTTGIGLLKQELRDLNSPLMCIAEKTQVPAGKAFAVDRDNFSTYITQSITGNPYITLIRKPILSLDSPLLEHADRIVIAAGPLAHAELSQSIGKAVNKEHLYFYDAIAPIINANSVDMSHAFWGERYGEPGTGDYLNCPMTKDEYFIFYNALLKGEKVPNHKFEEEKHFEGCMPIETLAERGEKTLIFGPLKPVGFIDPRTKDRPYALLQLRPENLNKTMFNLVGCQTKLTYAAQNEVFRIIPGLKHAEFIRMGSMHRNTYVHAPSALTDLLTLHQYPHIHLAGQITGVEGYVESIACGLWVGILITNLAKNITITKPPTTSALGGLLNHLSRPTKNFQPSNSHFGLTPEPTEKIKKKERKAWYANRARKDFLQWKNTLKELKVTTI